MMTLVAYSDGQFCKVDFFDDGTGLLCCASGEFGAADEIGVLAATL